MNEQRRTFVRAGLAAGVALLTATRTTHATEPAALQLSTDRAAGFHNLAYGGLNVAASVSIAGVSARMMSAGSSVGQRIFNSELKAGATAAGFISDGITFLSPLAAPQQANCSRQ